MADYDQPDYVEKRVRYFDGQFLKDQDFVDEQKYFIDRQRRYNRFLNVSGIVDGLAVKVKPGTTDLVTVDPGTALDVKGRQIVLSDQGPETDRQVPLQSLRGATADLVMTYTEEGSDQAQAGSAGFTRFYEKPQLTTIPSGQTAPDGAVTLARLTINATGGVEVNNTVRVYAGVRLPYDGAAPGTGPALRAGSTNRLDLTGDLSVSGNVGLGTTSPGAKLHVVHDNIPCLQADSSSGLGTWLSLKNTSPSGHNWNVISSGKDNGEGAGKLLFNDQSGGGTRLVIDTAGNVGIGTSDPKGFQVVLPESNKGSSAPGPGVTIAGGANGNASIELRNNGSGTPYIDFAQDGTKTDYDARIRLTAPGQLAIEGANVSIGTTTPRSALDTGIGVMSGAANDYQKAQYTLSGGGTVTWGGPSGRLKWTGRFIAITMGGSAQVASMGHIEINQPTTNLPAANVYDGNARSATADGIVLNVWEALYAVHTVGGDKVAVTLRIQKYDNGFFAPSNWLLIAVVNGDDNTIKLGTGVILSQKSSSTKGSPLPTGTILMWSGAITAIPDGWALCNGQNGTPNLTGRFIMGRANDSEAASGGASTHGHGGTSGPLGDVPRTTAMGGLSYELGGVNHYHNVGSAGHLPPYYLLAFIMKL